MKKKKIAFAGIMVSILMASGAAFAVEDEAPTSLTTKNYVDSGLRAVYGIASGKADASAVTELSNTVSGHTTAIGNIETALNGTEETDGLIERVSDLETSVAGKASADDLTTLSNKVNNATTGLDSKASQADLNTLQQQVNGLDTTAYTGINGVTVSGHNVGLNVSATAGKMYVYTSTGWDELPVENTWDASILTQ